MNKPLKIIWAVDPYTGAPLQRTALTAIKAFTRRRAATIEPVYILTTFLDSTPSQTSGDVAELTRATATQRLAKVPGISELDELEALTVLTEFARSIREKADHLIEYARAKHADTIVLATHGRGNIEKWFLGSFADSVMQQSDIPVLIFNPHSEGNAELKTLIFPTDFSRESKEAFRRVLTFAHSARLRVTLFHALTLAISPEERLMLTHRFDYKRSLRGALADRKALAAAWVLEAKRRGVAVTPFIDANDATSVADSVLSYQKKKGGIIALASRGEDTLPFLIGRTTRAVVQGSTSAVWVLYPSDKRAALKAAA